MHHIAGHNTRTCLHLSALRSNQCNAATSPHVPLRLAPDHQLGHTRVPQQASVLITWSPHNQSITVSSLAAEAGPGRASVLPSWGRHLESATLPPAAETRRGLETTRLEIETLRSQTFLQRGVKPSCWAEKSCDVMVAVLSLAQLPWRHGDPGHLPRGGGGLPVRQDPAHKQLHQCQLLHGEDLEFQRTIYGRDYPGNIIYFLLNFPTVFQNFNFQLHVQSIVPRMSI